MLRIAVVDDDQIAISRLRECLNHYSEEKGVNFNIKVYQNGIDLLVGYRSDYDIIFLDVDMPDINGFQTARRIRELDECVILVFVTNLAQYAIEGYKYHAADYIVKPLKYHTFALKMHMILKHCQTHQQTSIFVKTKNGALGIRPEHIALSSQAEGGVPLVMDTLEILGADNLAHGRWGEQKLVVRLAHQERPTAGSTLWLHLPENQLHLFDGETGQRV